MTHVLLALDVILFGFCLWLGFYLVARDLGKPYLLLTGLALVSYGGVFATDSLRQWAPDAAVDVRLVQLHLVFLTLPPLLWSGTLLALLPEGSRFRSRLEPVWRYSLLPVAVVLVFVAAGTRPPVEASNPVLRLPDVALLLITGVLLLPVVLGAALIQHLARAGWQKQSFGLLLLAVLFTTLSTGALFFPVAWLPRWLLVLLLGLDLALLGGAIAVLDAFDEGEALLPDLLRSFDYAFFTALVFGGQIALVMWAGTGATFAMIVLLFAVVATAIAWQTFGNVVEDALDAVAFAQFPGIRQTRADLRAAADAVPRRPHALDLEAMDDDEFVRLTRRALSHFGDLPRLAASPLTHLPAIEERLEERDAAGDTLERAAELKALLAESVERLKPRGDDEFGTTDEWRYYNVLYFPYVAGLKPYSRRADHTDLSRAERDALDWFRTAVPERTFYHWQSTAAELVAQDVLERSQRATLLQTD